MAWPLDLGLGLGLALGWGAGGGASSSLLSKWRGFMSFLGAWAGGLGVLAGGFLSPLVVVVVVVLLLLRLLLLLSPPSSPILTQPLRYGSMPPQLMPAYHLPNP